MPLHVLDDDLWFPPVTEALEDGLLAIGGDLTPERLLLAYSNGIFPWFNEDEMPMWWSPDPRFVLFPEELKVSKSMKQLLRKEAFEFKINSSFEEVIRHCQQVRRNRQDGTWITKEFEKAYTEMYNRGYAHCAEAWKDGVMVGELYGIRLGKVFFGESMFSHVSNASKYAFVKYVQHLRNEGVEMIDCQVIKTWKALAEQRMIAREEFVSKLETYLKS